MEPHENEVVTGEAAESSRKPRRPSRLWFVRLALVLTGVGVAANQAIVRSRWSLPQEWNDATHSIYRRGERAYMHALELSVDVALALAIAFFVLAVISLARGRFGSMSFDALAVLVCLPWLFDSFLTLALAFT